MLLDGALDYLACDGLVGEAFLGDFLGRARAAGFAPGGVGLFRILKSLRFMLFFQFSFLPLAPRSLVFQRWTRPLVRSMLPSCRG